jgi:hypothetical protein
MIAPLARLIDGLSVQKNFMRMPSIDERTLRLEEALQFLKGPGLHPRRKPAGASLSDTRLWTERTPCTRRKILPVLEQWYDILYLQDVTRFAGSDLIIAFHIDIGT